MPACLRAATALFVAALSRHDSRKPSGGTQQFGPLGPQLGWFSMFGMQRSTPHDAVVLQFGPPSVARMTNVLPGAPRSVWATERSASAVGVPPYGDPAVLLRRAVVVGPSAPGGSPG